MSEHALVERIKKKLRELGCVVRKRHGSPLVTKGDPDLYGSTAQGHHFEIEVKQPGGRLTQTQLARLAEWGRAKAFTGFATSVEEAVAIVRPTFNRDEAAIVPNVNPWRDAEWKAGGNVKLSPCHDASVVISHTEGVFIGTCLICHAIVFRINPKTNQPEVPL